MSGERPEELAREGLEHLQAAAREVIRATRSLLDAAEELVDDPAAVQSVVGTIASLAQAAAGRLRSEAHPRSRSSRSDEGDEASTPGRVQHIRVS